MSETRWQRERRIGKEAPNHFRMKRRANQSARYLNKRESLMHRETFDRAGNRKEIAFDYDANR